MQWRELGHATGGNYDAAELKICELCGAINLDTNAECCVCSWHGRFERRPEVIRVAIDLARRQDGRLDLPWLSASSRGRLPFLTALRLRLTLWLRRARGPRQPQGS